MPDYPRPDDVVGAGNRPASTTPTTTKYIFSLEHTRSYRLSHISLRIVKMSGRLATGLEAILKAGYAIDSYARHKPNRTCNSLIPPQALENPKPTALPAGGHSRLELTTTVKRN
jgi:hypothetical protein